MEITIFYLVFTFLVGLTIGSFLNVLIYRLPREIDVVIMRSFCPSCKKTIYWYENIPIFSFLFLKGRCRKCNDKISLRYPFIELLTASFALLLFPKYITLYSLTGYLFLICVLSIFIVHFFIDIDYKILPNSLNLMLLGLFLAYSIWHHHWTYWLIGGVVGFGMPLLVTWGFYLLRGKVGLGGGDIKLFGCLGIFLGVEGVVHNIFLSCLLGSVVGGTLLLLNKMKREDPIPFGPFIIIVAAIQILIPKYKYYLFSLL